MSGGIRYRQQHILDLPPDPQPSAYSVPEPVRNSNELRVIEVMDVPLGGGGADMPSVSAVSEASSHSSLRDVQQSYGKQSRQPALRVKPNCTSWGMMCMLAAFCLTMVILAAILFVQSQPILSNMNTISNNVKILTDLAVSRREDLNTTVSNLVDMIAVIRPDFVAQINGLGDRFGDVVATIKGVVEDPQVQADFKTLTDGISQGQLGVISQRIQAVIVAANTIVEATSVGGVRIQFGTGTA
jgi:hypothetical protein